MATVGDGVNAFKVRFTNISSATWSFHSRSTLLTLEPGISAGIEPGPVLQETVVAFESADPGTGRLSTARTTTLRSSSASRACHHRPEAAAPALTCPDGPQASDPLPRRRRRPRRQGHQLRRPARRGRPGRARRALRRRGRRRARLPRHHRLAREARDDRRAGAPHGGQRLHPLHDRRRHPLGRGRPGRARRRRRQGLRQLLGAGPPGAARPSSPRSSGPSAW